MQIARQLNNLLGGLTEYSHRSADLTVEQINSPNYDTAKASAVRLMPDDINFYWGNHHVTFNEFLTNNPISNDFLITRKLFGGSHNYLPASLEQFCIDFNDSKIDSRLASNIEAMGISVGVMVILFTCNMKIKN
jgi:hypothetical protein